MTNIDKINDYSVTGKFKINCSIKADKDSAEVKQLILEIQMDKIPLRDVITKALRPVVISWQNGPGRSKFMSWKDHQVIGIDFTSPGRKVKTREESIDELSLAFQKAGVDKVQSLELATKSVDNPVVLEDS